MDSLTNEYNLSNEYDEEHATMSTCICCAEHELNEHSDLCYAQGLTTQWHRFTKTSEKRFGETEKLFKEQIANLRNALKTQQANQQLAHDKKLVFERDRLKTQNMLLELQLNDAKKTIETYQKNLSENTIPIQKNPLAPNNVPFFVQGIILDDD